MVSRDKSSDFIRRCIPGESRPRRARIAAGISSARMVLPSLARCAASAGAGRLARKCRPSHPRGRCSPRRGTRRDFARLGTIKQQDDQRLAWGATGRLMPLEGHESHSRAPSAPGPAAMPRSDQRRTCARRARHRRHHDHLSRRQVCRAFPPGRIHSVIGFKRTVIGASVLRLALPRGCAGVREPEPSTTG